MRFIYFGFLTCHGSPTQKEKKPTPCMSQIIIEIFQAQEQIDAIHRDGALSEILLANQISELIIYVPI